MNNSSNDSKTNNSVNNPIIESQHANHDKENLQANIAKEGANLSKNKFYQNLVPSKNVSPYLKGKANLKNANPKGITKNYTRKNGK
ncbi:hypothetical protein ABSA28_00328 [Candidatus Hepatincolaceae symbiont of Richtersius coronifer]